MKLTVLVDNYTYIDQYFLAEPALSFLIEDQGKKILFDMGYSDVCKVNATKMNIDLNQVNYLVFSHGHNDHTGGLRYLLDLQQDIQCICHPDCDETKYYANQEVGMSIKLSKLPQNFKVKKTKHPVWLTENLLFLGQIARTVQPLRPLEKDFLYDDTALAYMAKEGLVIITGCSHSGICNIIEQAKKLCQQEKVLTVIGGLHLLNDPLQTSEVVQYFKKQRIKQVYPCHCTDLSAKIALSSVSEVKEVGVSLQLEF